jgi:hypothetical protein
MIDRKQVFEETEVKKDFLMYKLKCQVFEFK